MENYYRQLKWALSPWILIPLHHTLSYGMLTLSVKIKGNKFFSELLSDNALYRRDFRLLIGPDPDKPLPHPVIWFYDNVTMTTVRHTLIILTN